MTQLAENLKSALILIDEFFSDVLIKNNAKKTSESPTKIVFEGGNISFEFCYDLQCQHMVFSGIYMVFKENDSRFNIKDLVEYKNKDIEFDIKEYFEKNKTSYESYKDMFLEIEPDFIGTPVSLWEKSFSEYLSNKYPW